MEPKNLRTEEQKTEVESSEEGNNLHKVTPLSKYLAMALFVTLPFIGGWIGYNIAPEKIVEVKKVVLNEEDSDKNDQGEQDSIENIAAETESFATPSGDPQTTTGAASDDALDVPLITNIDPDFGLPGTAISIETNGQIPNDVVVFFSGRAVGVDSITDTSISITVPDDVNTGPVYIQSGSNTSNSVMFFVSEIGVVAPRETALDELGNEVGLDTLFVGFKVDYATKESAERIAELVSGTVVGHIPLLNGWQLSVNADSLEALQALQKTIEEDPAVEFTILDVAIEDEGEGDF